jgi:hypothetical protein
MALDDWIVMVWKAYGRVGLISSGISAYRNAYLVEALYYKPEGRGFSSR